MTEQHYRKKLPDTRDSLTHRAIIQSRTLGEVDLYLTVGFYEDGTLGEIFGSIGKQGSTMIGLFDSYAIMVSIALQYGVPLESIVKKFRGVSFEPCGSVETEAGVASTIIPECSSVVDYAVRWLEHLDARRKAAVV